MAAGQLLTAEQEVRRRIAARGAITFAEFMDVALYWPCGGYYTSYSRIGPEGDYYTSSLVHPAFGALLCVQLYQMWEMMERPARFHVVELGAGNGNLARDILEYARHLPSGFSRALRYICVDRQSVHRHEAGTTAERVTSSGVPFRGIAGCILSNELVDAFPVHRVTVRNGKLLEMYISEHGGELLEVLDAPSTPLLRQRLDALGVRLTEGYRIEINLAVDGWMRDVAAALARGFVLTIDYGYTADEYYSSGRSGGTLMCARRHRLEQDPYARIGQQDITAHVDFTSLIRAGEAVGLNTVALTTQRQFLVGLGLFRMLPRLREAGLSAQEMEANRQSMMHLVGPGGLGRFKVLVQAKGVVGEGLWGVIGGTPDMGAPAPLLTPGHLRLTSGCREDAAGQPQ